MFGVIRKDESELIEKYKIKKFPSIIVVKVGEKKPILYKDEMKFQPIFEFLNIYSEAFVAGGGDSSYTETASVKYWNTETVPEMNSKSSNDICFSVIINIF